MEPVNNVLPTSLAASILLAIGSSSSPAQSTDAQRAVDALIAVDRDHARRAQRANVVDALGGMFADDVVLSAVGAFHFGREAALAQLRGVPENLTGRLEWSPVRGGISADGQHGFTYGFMTLVRADSTRVPLKYLAYWVKKPDGLEGRSVQARAPAGGRSLDRDARAFTAVEVRSHAIGDASVIARHARELGQAERDFSTLAGKIGLGPAFTQNAAPDAMNMGGPQNADFLYGPAAIGAGVGAGRIRSVDAHLGSRHRPRRLERRPRRDHRPHQCTGKCHRRASALSVLYDLEEGWGVWRFVAE